MSSLLGIPVVESNFLPLRPSPGAEARRIVRHGFAAIYSDFEDWAGPVGPKPDALTHALMLGGTLHASASMVLTIANASDTPAASEGETNP